MSSMVTVLCDRCGHHVQLSDRVPQDDGQVLRLMATALVAIIGREGGRVRIEYSELVVIEGVVPKFQTHRDGSLSIELVESPANREEPSG